MMPWWAVAVVELLKLPQGVEKMPFVADQGPVQQLATAGLHPSLHEGVHAGDPDAAEHDLNPRVLEDGVEQFRELAVPVPDHVARPTAGVLKVHGEVLRRLRHPGRGRMSGGAEDPDSAVGVLDDCEHVQPGSGQGDRFE